MIHTARVLNTGVHLLNEITHLFLWMALNRADWSLVRQLASLPSTTPRPMCEPYPVSSPSTVMVIPYTSTCCLTAKLRITIMPQPHRHHFHHSSESRCSSFQQALGTSGGQFSQHMQELLDACAYQEYHTR